MSDTPFHRYSAMPFSLLSSVALSFLSILSLFLLLLACVWKQERKRSRTPVPCKLQLTEDGIPLLPPSRELQGLPEAKIFSQPAQEFLKSLHNYLRGPESSLENVFSANASQPGAEDARFALFLEFTARGGVGWDEVSRMRSCSEMSTWLAKVLSCDQKDNSYLLTLLHCAKELWGKDSPEDGDLGSQDPTIVNSEDVHMEDDRTLGVKIKSEEERKEKEGKGEMSTDHKEMEEGLKRLDSKQSNGGSEMITRSLTTLNFSMLPLNTRDCETITWVLSSHKLLAKHNLGMQPDGCVTSLSCDYSYLSNEALRALVPIMHRCLELRFCENFLSDDIIPLFVGVLKNPDCSIKQLALRSNSLTDTSVPLLCEGISINSSLLWLWLGGNDFSQEGISQLEQAAQGRPEMHLMI
uniref:Uncharacterized protein n=1 Tax=Eptatretus burgeri TaxID=7764 RepID=A0A8C4R4Y0_EPTBU